MSTTKIRFRRDTAANWTSNDPTLTTGELGYETNTGKFKIGDNSTAWTSLAYSITAELSEGNLNDLKDVTISSAANGDFLRWNGTVWVNDAVNLSTDTVGSFVESLVAGTGVTLSNNSGEGATPTVAVDTTVIQARVTNVTDIEIGYLDGVTSAIQTQLGLKAPLASPTFTGTPTLPTGTIATTQTAADSSTKVATTAFVTDAVTTGVASATVDNLDDISDVTITSATSGDLLKWNGTVWVNAAGYALLASPTFTGTPIAPTQAAGNDTTRLATTAFVTTAVSSITPSTTVIDGGNADTLQFHVLGAINAGGI